MVFIDFKNENNFRLRYEHHKGCNKPALFDLTGSFTTYALAYQYVKVYCQNHGIKFSYL